MTEPTSRYRSEAQVLADEFRNSVYTETSQQILQSIEHEIQSTESRNETIQKLSGHIDYLENNYLEPVLTDEIFIRGNVTSESMYFI